MDQGPYLSGYKDHVCWGTYWVPLIWGKTCCVEMWDTGMNTGFRCVVKAFADLLAVRPQLMQQRPG